MDSTVPTEHTVPIAVYLAQKQVGNWIAVTNVQHEVVEQVHEISVEDEVRECFEKLQGTSVHSSTRYYSKLKFCRMSGLTSTHTCQLCQH